MLQRNGSLLLGGAETHKEMVAHYYRWGQKTIQTLNWDDQIPTYPILGVTASKETNTTRRFVRLVSLTAVG